MNTHAMASEQSIPRFVSRADVMRLTGLSDTTLWRCVRRGDLPSPTRLSPGRVAWEEKTILDWLSKRAAEASR